MPVHRHDPAGDRYREQRPREASPEVTNHLVGFVEAAAVGTIAALAPAGIAVVHVLADEQAPAEPDSFGRYALATLLVSLVTVPLIRWVITRLDRHLVAQDKHNVKMSKLITLLIAEYQQKRKENNQLHEDAMSAIAQIEKILEEDGTPETEDEKPDGS